MKTNTRAKAETVRTHEGMKVAKASDYMALRRSVLTSLLFEDSYYEDGTSIAQRIQSLVPKCKPEEVANLAVEARTNFKLRHIPLFLTRELVRYENARPLVEDTLSKVIQRADELSEFLSLYWKEGKQPLANSVKRGLARAFIKFSEYDLAKYNQKNEIKLRDVLFLTHPKPLSEEQARTWKRLVDNELQTPDTWEVELSTKKGVDKQESWERLLKENKLGPLALLKNLRNFKENNVDEKLIVNALNKMKVEMVLPYRFISAARYYPGLESQLEQSMFKCVKDLPVLKGKTALVIDTSPSMWGANISAKSDMTRFEAAAALAILLRETCELVKVYAFNTKAYEVPNRRGFALRDVLEKTRDGYSRGSLAIEMANKDGYDRIICLTDGQWHDVVDGQLVDNLNHLLRNGTNYSPLANSNAYMINISNEKNGVGYKNQWLNIDGFSESVISYIMALEAEPD